MTLTMYPRGAVDIAAKAKALLAEKKQKGAVWHKTNSRAVYFDTDIPVDDVRSYMGDDIAIISEAVNLNQRVPERV